MDGVIETCATASAPLQERLRISASSAMRRVFESLYLIRAFVQMRESLQENVTVLKRLAEIDRRLIEHDSVLREVVERLQPLLDAPEVEPETKPKIGFHPGNR